MLQNQSKQTYVKPPAFWGPYQILKPSYTIPLDTRRPRIEEPNIVTLKPEGEVNFTMEALCKLDLGFAPEEFNHASVQMKLERALKKRE